MNEQSKWRKPEEGEVNKVKLQFLSVCNRASLPVLVGEK